MKSHQVSNSSISGIIHQIRKRALSPRSVDPFLEGTSWKIAIVINHSSPSWHDVEPGPAIACYGGVQRPEPALCIEKKGSSVVANHVSDSVIQPSPDRICIVEAGDGRRDDAIGAEMLCRSKAYLAEPALVELYFFGSIGIGGIGEVGVSTRKCQIGKEEHAVLLTMCEKCAQKHRGSLLLRTSSGAGLSQHTPGSTYTL